ncbi:methyltransferase domain-containing protein [Gottschalkiaceae bacterium SANA]|nr:methyltransferase domain-containing protein [Gottschalkiaceae bacterium SANA]
MIDQILQCMAMAQSEPEIQRIQTRHRIRLAEIWGIEEGDRILEIGCGQGDTTAVLAYLVGESGFVHGIDLADPDYGSPVSVGESAKFLMKSSLGSRIQMDFNFDFLQEEAPLEAEGYDLVVLSHASWYLKSQDQLLEILKKARRIADRICFAEADLRIDRLDQVPHMLAVLIQAQVEVFKTNSRSNIRTLVGHEDTIQLLERAGWHIVEEDRIEEPDLQDGEWEIQYTLHEVMQEVTCMEGLPEKWGDLMRSMGELLGNFEGKEMAAPLGSFIIIGE